MLTNGLFKWDGYAYKDKRREAKRLQELDVKRSGEADEERQRLRKNRQEKKKRNEAWSSKSLQREQRDQRRQKKVRKRAWEKAGQTTSTSTQDEHPGDDSDGAEDWEELKRENRLAKKAKRANFVSSDL